MNCPHKSPFLALGGMLLIGLCPTAMAQNYYDWDGGGGTTTWWTSSNWAPDSAITAINADASAVLRFDGTPASIPLSSGLPGNSQMVVNKLWFTGAFNATETAEIVLGNAGVADLQLRGVSPMIQVDNGLVSTSQSAGSEIRLNGDTTFQVGGELRINGAIINHSGAAPANLSKTGFGVLRLRGNNSMGGPNRQLRLVEGVIDIDQDLALGAPATTFVFAGAGGVPAWLRVDAGGGNRQISHPIALEGNGGYNLDIGPSDPVGVTLTDALEPGNSGQLPVLRKQGAGTLRLAANSAFSWIFLLDGRLVPGGIDAIDGWNQVAIDFPMSSDAILSLDGHDTGIGSLSAPAGSAAAVENGSAEDLHLAFYGQTGRSFAGQIRDGGAGKLHLEYAHTGGSAHTLAGANSFTGDVDVHGKLHIEHSAALGSVVAPTRVHAGGELSMTALSIAEPIELAGGLVRIGDGASSMLTGPVNLVADSLLEGASASLDLRGTLDLGAHTLRTRGYLWLVLTDASYAPGARIEVENGRFAVRYPARLADADTAPSIDLAQGADLVLHIEPSTPPLANALRFSGVDDNGPGLTIIDEGGVAQTYALNGPIELVDTITVESNDDIAVAFNGEVSGGGGLQKIGGFRLLLNGPSPFTGDIDVDDGELSVYTSLSASGVTRVNGPGCCATRHPAGTSDALVSGSGTLGGVELFGGRIGPGGAGVATLAAGPVQIADVGAVFEFHLGANPADPAASDRLLVQSLNLAPGGKIGLRFGDGVGTAAPGRYRLIETQIGHGLTASDFVVQSYDGLLVDFGGRIRVGSQFVDLELIPGHLFADDFE